MSKSIVILSILLLWMSGCEQTSCTYMKLYNSSQHNLYVDLFYGQNKAPKSVIDLPDGSTRSIWFDSDQGILPIPNLALANIDSIHFSSRELSKGFDEITKGRSPYREEYWTQKTTNRSGGGSYTSLIFEITDNDIDTWLDK